MKLYFIEVSVLKFLLFPRLTCKYVCRACETLAVSVVTNCGSFLQKVAAYFEGCGKKLLKHSDFILRKKRRCRWSPNPELDNWKRYVCIQYSFQVDFSQKGIFLFLSFLINSSLNSQIYMFYLKELKFYFSWFRRKSYSIRQMVSTYGFSLVSAVPWRQSIWIFN